MQHLTEDEIQTYLDGCSKEARQPIEAHLAKCPACRMLLNDYKRLYVALADDSGLVPVKNLPLVVAARLGQRPRPSRRRLPSEIMVGTAGIATALVLAFYFLDLSDAIVGFVTHLPQLIRETLGQVTMLRDLTAAHGTTLILVTFAGMILTIVAILDTARLRRRPVRPR